MSPCRSICILVLTLLTALSPRTAWAAGGAQDSIVTIVATLTEGRALGSGFLYSGDGRILTCYHVIQGATQLQVYSASGDVADNKDVVVESTAPDYDLAVLNVRRFAGQAFIPVDERLPVAGDEVTIFGAAARLEQQQLQGYVTRAAVQSGAVRGPRGERLFSKPNVSVVPLQTVIYDGLSGGPVVLRGKAIGVISGSLNQGGAIGWAIPVSYLRRATRLNATAAEIRWPPLTLMDPKVWNNLRRSVRDVSPLLTQVDAYFSAVDAFDAAQVAFMAALIKARVDFMVFDSWLQNGTQQTAPPQALSDAIENSGAALTAADQELQRSFAAMWQQASGLSHTLDKRVAQIPYVPANLPVLNDFREALAGARKGMQAAVLPSELEKLLGSAVLAAEDERYSAKWRAHLHEFITRLAAIDLDRIESELARIGQARRDLGRAIRMLLLADLVGFGVPWSYASQSAIHVDFPPGRWELAERFTPEFVARIGRSQANYGLKLEGLFANWTNRTPGETAPQVVMALLTALTLPQSLDQYEASMRSAIPTARVSREIAGGKRVIVREIPFDDGKNVTVQLDWISSGRLIRLEVWGERLATDALRSELRTILGSVTSPASH